MTLWLCLSISQLHPLSENGKLSEYDLALQNTRNSMPVDVVNHRQERRITRACFLTESLSTVPK